MPRAPYAGIQGYPPIGLLLAVYAFAWSGCGGTEESPSVTSFSLTSDVRPIDAPSAPPIVLHWTSPQDGSNSLRDLQFEVENTSDTPLDVMVHVTSQAGEHRASAAPLSVTVLPHTGVDQAIGVKQLGIQLVGAPVTTFVAATYTDSEGTTRGSALPSVFVEHQKGFESATVRAPVEEARENAKYGLSVARARTATAGRELDAATGAVVDIRNPGDSTWLGTRMILQPSELPDPAEYRAANPARVVDEDTSLSDAERAASAQEPADGTFDKGGSYQVCFNLPYWYYDSLYGEDYLIGQTATVEGYEPARYMLAALVNSAGTIIWSGSLSSVGCTPNVNHANGSYTGYLTTSLYRSATDVLIDVTTDDTKTFLWGALPYSISGSGGTKALTFTGAWSLPDAAIAAANTIYRATNAYPNGTRTNIYTDQDCPGHAGSGCSVGTAIYIGTNKNGWQNAAFKVVVEHELGHRVQGALMGVPNNNYTIDSDNAACRCDHVTSTEISHCLQGRHYSWAAQVEGWGQFFAVENLNNGADANCTLAYYKEFRNDNGTVTNPPMAKSCYNQVKWMVNHCGGVSDRGTEFDWMGFYWNMQNKQAYSFADFTNVYHTACGGSSCSGDPVTWAATTAAATLTFGINSPKATAWATQGNNYGVNY